MAKKILITGNEAVVEGALAAGCKFYAGYPITPQNELIAYMAQKLPESGGVFLQAESELSAINMVFGASATGFRAMTSSSSPGISLKQEGISYIAGAELPAVIVNMMRGGPGLGNISPSQADYFQATKGGGHGDYHSIVLAPGSIQECYDLMLVAFDLADKYRTPVIILGDGLIGQMMEPLVRQGAEHKVKDYAKPWALTGCKGRKQNIVRSLYLGQGALEKVNLRLQERYQKIIQEEQRSQSFQIEDCDFVLVAYGTMSRIAKGAVLALRKKGIKAGLIRPVSLWPFPEKIIAEAAKKVKAFLVIEMSYGQMLEDVRLSVAGKAPVHFLGRGGGEIPSEEEIVKKIEGVNKK
ncbi:MAG: 3-methyl-2-oxobutanoate dehydrogenase subunit VorB [Candidatus Omnitrophica bacterium]|nr:3-methyl-2-oxobutanoate dehydrogenase subunit VorB [Candidatus Omnitrophota bacterium]MDD5236595.1 3-methyl-2-oxobutanoate dehydrogenase subunit VorB [Candidatus Omnitrophota bacterium]MDD5610723.1 3-methyl-2-oxobutanoate dehydrogenase subunit VorB [Candidatus Omnitrophota bacterium]